MIRCLNGLLGLVFLCALIFPNRLQAGHIAGVDISYECINSCTIRVNFRAYRDCSSSISNVSPIGTLFINADSGCVMPTLIGAWINSSNVEVTPVCPGTPTGCNTPGAAINGIMEHYWVGEYDFCAANCSTYTIGWSTCCRNSSISTLVLPAGTGLSATATINPLLIPCNSGPVFNNPPVPVLCQNQCYVFSQGATDPDGDSLSYSLGTCMQGPTPAIPNPHPVNYLAFTSPTRPLGPDWTVTLDSLTGDLEICPDQTGPSPGSIQTGVLCVYVQEWRNGVLINTIVRDIQITIVPCPPNDPPTTFGIGNMTGGVGSGFRASTCLGATICFDIRTNDSDPSQVHTVFWNQSLAQYGATFTLASNPTIQNVIVGQQPTTRFCWTPTVVGSFSFTITMRDDACPIYGISQYTFQIDVSQIELVAQDLITDCKEVELCALPVAGFGGYTYNWTGIGGLSSNPGHLDSCVIHSYPAAGTFPYHLTVFDSIGCRADFADTIRIASNVLADAGPNDSACSNQAIIIGLPALPGQNLTYAWTPPIGLGNANSPQPTVTLANNSLLPRNQIYTLTVQDTVTFCYYQDSMMVTVFPTPSSPFNMQDTACQFEQVGFAYLGTNGPTATYNWTFAGGTPANATGQGPHFASFAAQGRHEVTLTVTENGCNSPTQRDTIQIMPIPVANIQPVADQCLVSNNYNFSNLGFFTTLATHNWAFWPNAIPTSSTAQNPNGVVFTTAGPKIVTVVTTDKGCSSRPDTLHLNINPDPDAVWGVVGGVQCFDGNSHQFVANAGNGPTASYSWTFQDGAPATSSDTLPLVSFLSPGPKLVTLTVNAFGCVSTYSNTIMVYPEPSVSTGPNVAFCEGDGGADLHAYVTGGTAPFYFTWSCNGPIGFCGIDSINDNDPHVNPTGNTWYYVTVVDANGCQNGPDSVFVVVNPKPIVDAGPDLTICGDSAPCQVLTPSVSNGYGPYTYQWLPGTGLNNATLLNPCARPDSTTIYALVATDQSTGCSSAYNTLDTLSTVTVHVNPVPIADAGPKYDACLGDTIQLQGTGSGAGPNYQYQWTPANGLSNPATASPLAFPQLTTTYSLVVFSNGCPSYADTVTVNVHTLPTVDAGWDREICLGDSIVLDATAGGDSTAQYSFSWSSANSLNNPFIEDPSASPRTTTTYFVVAQSSWGCKSDSDSVTVMLLPTPLAEAGSNLQICDGDSIVLEGGYYYGPTDSVPDVTQIYFAWSPAQTMTDSTRPDPTVSPNTSTWYYLDVNYNVCETHDSVLVTVIPQLNANFALDTNRICAGDSVTLHASGGFGNPSYEWQPAAFLDDPHAASPLAFPPNSMTFYLILGESGCFDTLSMDVEVLPSPDVSYLHSDNSGCAPLSLSLMQNSSDATAYIWDFGDGSAVSNQANPIHVYAQPGDYPLRFTAVNAGGCNHSSPILNVHVAANPIPQVVSSPTAPAVLYLPKAEIFVEELNPQSTQWTWNFGDGIQMQGKNQSHTYYEVGIWMVDVLVSNLEGCTSKMQIGPFEVRAPDLFIPNVFSPNGDGINDAFLVQYQGDQPFAIKVHDRWGATLFESNNKFAGWNGMGQANVGVPDGVYYYWVRIGAKEYVGEVTLVR